MTATGGVDRIRLKGAKPLKGVKVSFMAEAPDLRALPGLEDFDFPDLGSLKMTANVNDRSGNLDVEALAAAGEPAYVGGGIVNQGAPMVAGPGGRGFPGQPGSLAPAGHIAGVTTSNYGMPWTATPIGLPGPAHLPFGHKAGLQAYNMKNTTPMQ